MSSKRTAASDFRQRSKKERGRKGSCTNLLAIDTRDSLHPFAFKAPASNDAKGAGFL